MNRIAIVRIRGKNHIQKRVADTLKMLRLYKVNGCVVVPNNPIYVGMIKKAKDYITWGEIDETTFKDLLVKRGKIVGDKPLTEEYFKEKSKFGFDDFIKKYYDGKIELKDVPGVKPFFRLSPPSKGYERKGIKKPFSMGGAIGYRKEKINLLIKRML
ncbi:50S ribosomal protein L30 [archaeon]|nr:50S ribosomal protein L30 [archaeon]|tara:strand:- start:96 stop:566 length:471 start_codon:yes stop_codon:yes gene_type:complete